MGKLLKIALFGALLMALFPLGAASMDVIPYINITNPADGSTVSGITPIEVKAEGNNLENPFLSIEGEYVGIGFPLTNCIYSVSEDGGPASMYCSYNWDSQGFEKQNVRITASVNEQGGTISDNIGVYVSGECA